MILEKIKWIYMKILILFLLLYLCFIPFGSFRIDVYGFPLDVCIGILLVSLTLFKSVDILRFYSFYLFFFLDIFIMSLLVSVVFSDDQLYSLYRLFVTCGYVYICFVLPVLLFDKSEYIAEKFFLMGVFASSIAIFITQFLFPEHFSVSRFNFASLDNPMEYGYTDPNILGYGIGLSLLVFICKMNLNVSVYKKIMYFLSCLLLLFTTVFLTQSRTVLFSLIVAFFTYGYFYRRRINIKFLLKSIFFLFYLCFFIFFIF